MKRMSFVFAVGALALMVGSASADHIWLNEFHYDNTGTDAGEFIEVAVRTGSPFTLADYSVVLYNGSGGASYDTDALSTAVATGPFPILGGLQTVTLYTLSYAPNGIQNGAPDGIAIVNTATNAVVQFLSYEGTFTATNGIANGTLSVDVGVLEDGLSLATSVAKVGTGNKAADFTWAVNTVATPGAVNTNQILAVPEPASVGLALCGALGLLGVRRRLA